MVWCDCGRVPEYHDRKQQQQFLLNLPFRCRPVFYHNKRTDMGEGGRVVVFRASINISPGRDGYAGVVIKVYVKCFRKPVEVFNKNTTLCYFRLQENNKHFKCLLLVS